MARLPQGVQHGMSLDASTTFADPLGEFCLYFIGLNWYSMTPPGLNQLSAESSVYSKN